MGRSWGWTASEKRSPSQRYLKLVESYALDGIDWFEPEKEHRALKSNVTKFIKASHAARVETHPSVGLGTDYRLESKKITGFALALDGQILHLSIFARTNGHDQNKYASKMQRYTQRRRNRVY